jgi:hypothetical protein
MTTPVYQASPSPQPPEEQLNNYKLFLLKKTSEPAFGTHQLSAEHPMTWAIAALFIFGHRSSVQY